VTDPRDELHRVFCAENEELLIELEDGAMALTNGGGRESLEAIFRSAHTLKGNASSLGFEAMTRVAHHLEDALSAALGPRGGTDPVLHALLLESLDVLSWLAHEAISHRDPGDDPAIDPICTRLGEWAARGTTSAPVALPARAARQTDNIQPPTRTVRVDVARLDRAMDAVGELAVARGRLADAIAHRDVARADALLQSVETLFLDLHAQILELRLVPLRGTFERLHRSAHDLGLSVGKEVRLEVESEGVEVDLRVAEALRAPLTHLLRNAIDHGIETPEARRRAGKHPGGTIKLSARREDGHLVVDVADDGAGLDRTRLLARGRELGLIGESPTDEQIWGLIFAPGLSTAEKVSEMSGRGIGMDVVRRSIDELRGDVRVHSVAGKGVTVSIKMPLSLSIVQGLAVRSAGETYVLPIDHVVECVKLERERAVASARGGVLELRGEALPFVRLSHQLGSSPAELGDVFVVVVEREGRRAGLAVDGLAGEVQTVIKPLARLFDGVRGVAGTAVLGDGRVALVVDVRSLLRDATMEGSNDAVFDVAG
jgi:two-component system chemotaxis sensor kinase CheA